MSFADYEAIAIAASHEAGRILSQRVGVAAGVESARGRDIKTAADRDAESAIFDILRAKSDFPILSEEAGGNFSSESTSTCWIVDPLDGTLNLSRGIPLCCVSIALWRGLAPLVGVVHDFNRNETFSGTVGEGARLNDSRIRVSGVDSASQGVICAGFPVESSFEDDDLRSYLATVRNWKKVRLIGSAALSLAWVACGRVDAYAERGIKLWDVAAGLALVSAAGGTFDITSPDSSHRADVFASNSVIQASLPAL